MSDPRTVIIEAYEALADRRLDDVLDRLDPAALGGVVERRLDMLHRVEISSYVESQSHVALLLRMFGVSSAEQLRSLPARDALRCSLAASPRWRDTIHCLAGGQTDADPSRASVQCRFASNLPFPDLGLEFMVELHRTPAGWKIQPVAISPWLLPGFAGVVVDERLQPPEEQ